MKQVLYKNDIYPYNVRVLLGADEHAAYIAGFVGNCAGEMFGFLEEEKDGKEE